jgi:hypothetical protein
MIAGQIGVNRGDEVVVHAMNRKNAADVNVRRLRSGYFAVDLCWPTGQWSGQLGVRALPKFVGEAMPPRPKRAAQTRGLPPKPRDLAFEAFIV